jgi:hypothetical protein
MTPPRLLIRGVFSFRIAKIAVSPTAVNSTIFRISYTRRYLFLRLF